MRGETVLVFASVCHNVVFCSSCCRISSYFVRTREIRVIQLFLELCNVSMRVSGNRWRFCILPWLHYGFSRLLNGNVVNIQWQRHLISVIFRKGHTNTVPHEGTHQFIPAGICISDKSHNPSAMDKSHIRASL